MLYFAYGSNMNKRQMLQRCPDAVPVGAAVLLNHKLIFRGVADIVPEGNYKGAEVKGSVWKITKKCLKALDRYEGYPYLYNRKTYQLMIPGTDQKVTAIAYFMRRGSLLAPSRGYWQSIMRGYFDFNIKPGLDLLSPNSTVNPEEAKSYDQESYYSKKKLFTL